MERAIINLSKDQANVAIAITLLTSLSYDAEKDLSFGGTTA